jgi:4-hydroxymandelate oxidase
MKMKTEAMTSGGISDNRRQFLRFLAATPVLQFLRLSSMLQQALADDQRNGDPDGSAPSVLKSLQLYGEQISSAREAVDVFDLETVARRKLHVGHLAYLAGGEDDATARANRDGFTRYALRGRRLAGVGKIVDTSVKMFGVKWDSPVMLCPCGSQAAFNSEAELAVARAAKTKKTLQVLSTGASKSIEDVSAARGTPVWFQLYMDFDWNKTLAMVKRAEAAGSPVLVFTVDALGGNNREILTKVRHQNAEFCETCHDKVPSGKAGGPMPATTPLGPPMMEKAPLTWEYVKRLKDSTKMKLVVKGIETREDAALAIEHGADGVWISNHGGRQENSLRSTVECVPEVVAGVAHRGPVIVDSGFRRGGDIFKALALGATAVGVGRPYLWGLAAFGQDGVETAIDILNAELQMVMRQVGTGSIEKISASYLIERRNASGV